MKKTLSALLSLAYLGIMLNFGFFVAFDSNPQNIKPVLKAAQNDYAWVYLDLRVARVTDSIVRVRKPLSLFAPYFALLVLLTVIFTACGISALPSLRPFVLRHHDFVRHLRAPPVIS